MQENLQQPILADRTNPDSPYYTPIPDFTDAQKLERAFDLQRLYKIAQLRESPWPQFDGMGYMKYNETNEFADISYLPPKKNKGETRITSGITHEKDSSLVSFYLNLNFEGTVRVFKSNTEDIEMGTALTKLVRKSKEMEHYDDKRAQFYRNFTAQGTAFVREQYTEVWVPNKVMTGDINPARLDEVKWVEKGLRKQRGYCETILVDPKKVFLENIREPDIQKQPGVYTVEYISRELLKSIWGQTKMWKYVPFMVSAGGMDSGTLTQGSLYSDWIYGEVDYTKLEVVTVYRPFEQRFQIYFNGIPMLEPGYPLQAVSPSGLIPIAKGDQDLMSMFAYSKSDPAKAKIDQAVFDELLQTMVMKSRQSAMVPRANNTGRILTPDMFLGGRMISNLDPSDTPPLIENPGITEADFKFFDYFKTHIDDKTVSAIFEQGIAPGTPGTSGTLGEYMDQQRKAMIKIGMKIDGIMNWEKQILELRTMNLLAHGAQKNEEGKYQNISMEDSMFDGSKGLNVIKFDESNVRSSEDVFNEQNQAQKQTGLPVEYTYIDPKQMREMINDDEYYFKYEVIPVDKQNDKMAQLMFIDMVTQAAQLFGPDSLQVSSLKKRYAQRFNENYDDIFVSDQDLQMKQQQAALAQQAQQNPTTLNAPVNPSAAIPSPFGASGTPTPATTQLNQ